VCERERERECVCVCVCACVRERERERETVRVYTGIIRAQNGNLEVLVYFLKAKQRYAVRKW
jgi:hypothetical protein